MCSLTKKKHITINQNHCLEAIIKRPLKHQRLYTYEKDFSSGKLKIMIQN